MLSTIKAIINNLNQFPYRKNINNVQVKTSGVANSNAKNLIPAQEHSLDEINRLETKVREKNLKVFSIAYFTVRSARFLYISLPAMLTASTIAYCFSPNYLNIHKDVDIYKGVHKLYNSELGVTEYEDKYLTLDTLESLANPYISDNGEEIEVTDYIKDDELVFKIYDDLNSFLAKFSINSDGELTLNNYVVGSIIDFNEYGEYDFSPVDQDYDLLVTKTINILLESGVLSEKESTVLKNLSESDRRVIVTEIHNYFMTEKENILVSKSKLFSKSMFIILTICYYFALVMGLSQKKPHYLKCKGPKIKNEKGELSFEKDSKEIYYGLIYGPLAIREEFIKAEYDRIMRIKNEIEEHTNPYANSILTKYERSLKPRDFER